MEKLIELLNECKWNSYRFHADWSNLIYQNETDAYGNVHITVLPDYKLISKQFWFIKRLVENYYIELPMFLRRIKSYDKENWYNYYSDYESLLMLLSISDEPISDLISYLK